MVEDAPVIVIDKAAEALRERLGGADVGAVIRFDIEGEGSVLVDGRSTPAAVSPHGAEQPAPAADVVIAADTDTFRGILDGAVNAASAYMGGRLRVEGDVSAALRLASALS